MEEITERDIEHRASECAQRFISRLDELNILVAKAENEEPLNLKGTLPMFTAIFVRILNDRFAIKPDEA